MIKFENHAFKGFDAALKELLALQWTTAGEIDQLIGLLPRGLDVADPDTFTQAKAIDKRINDAEIQTDRQVADIINKFTPMGEELRFILATVKVAGTLERAADKIKNCIKRLGKVSHPLDMTVKGDMAEAIEAVRAMLPKALEQLVDYQPERTIEILFHGAEVQSSYKSVLIYLHSQAELAPDATHVLLVAKNLEQTADMGVEIMKLGHYANYGTKYEKNRGE